MLFLYLNSLSWWMTSSFTGHTQIMNLVVIINSFNIFALKSYNFHLLILNVPTIFISLEKYLLHVNRTPATVWVEVSIFQLDGQLHCLRCCSASRSFSLNCSLSTVTNETFLESLPLLQP